MAQIKKIIQFFWAPNLVNLVDLFQKSVYFCITTLLFCLYVCIYVSMSLHKQVNTQYIIKSLKLVVNSRFLRIQILKCPNDFDLWLQLVSLANSRSTTQALYLLYLLKFYLAVATHATSFQNKPLFTLHYLFLDVEKRLSNQTLKQLS